VYTAMIAAIGKLGVRRYPAATRLVLA